MPCRIRHCDTTWRQAMEHISKSKNNPGLTPFALGFRPFFLFAGVAAIVLMLLWLRLYAAAWEGGDASAMAIVQYYGAIVWHGHEMLFGYTLAVIAGFLLTAVRNWTGHNTAAGLPLVALFLLWIAARVLPLLPLGIAPLWLALVDLAFLPLLMLALAIPLLRAGKGKNLIFLLLLGLMFVANVLIHLQALGVTQNTAAFAMDLMVYLIMLLIAIMGGRVIPFFTERGLGNVTIKRWVSLEIIAIASIVLLIIGRMLQLPAILLMIIAGLATLAHALRLFSWQARGLWSEPLLWVLHCGYAWLVIGLLLETLAHAGWVAPNLVRHAYTTGTIGVLTLGMMARVTLGHTGRHLQVTTPMSYAYALINLAVFVRVLLPIIIPQAYATLVLISGGLWILAFLIFVLRYAPMLVSARVDGKPG